MAMAEDAARECRSSRTGPRQRRLCHHIDPVPTLAEPTGEVFLAQAASARTTDHATSAAWPTDCSAWGWDGARFQEAMDALWPGNYDSILSLEQASIRGLPARHIALLSRPSD